MLLRHSSFFRRSLRHGNFSNFLKSNTANSTLNAGNFRLRCNISRCHDAFLVPCSSLGRTQLTNDGRSDPRVYSSGDNSPLLSQSRFTRNLKATTVKQTGTRFEASHVSSASVLALASNVCRITRFWSQ